LGGYSTRISDCFLHCSQSNVRISDRGCIGSGKRRLKGALPPQCGQTMGVMYGKFSKTLGDG
jgi:hypothetical protein